MEVHRAKRSASRVVCDPVSDFNPSMELREASYPAPYPDGWYRVAASDELGRGKVLYRECLGEQIVVFRSDKSDEVNAMGAFCPHMGANLAGGCVKGGNLECPFHLWQLSKEGHVAKIPYLDKAPPRLRQKTWPVHEAYGQIFLYHRGDTELPSADPPPPYAFPNIPEIDGGFVHRGDHSPRNVKMHILEFAENSVDFQHFGPLHTEMFVPWTDVRVPYIDIVHEARWEMDDEASHRAYFHNAAILKVFGRTIDKTKATAKITFHGPASVVTFHFKVPDMGEILMFQTHLPVAPLEQEVRFRWYADPKMPRWLASYVVGNWVSQWRNDLEVWENKIHLRKPVLVAGDGPIHKLRRWYSQFYPASAQLDAAE